jgi:hypothetical protein
MAPQVSQAEGAIELYGWEAVGQAEGGMHALQSEFVLPPQKDIRPVTRVCRVQHADVSQR